jgi:hypothetical protein
MNDMVLGQILAPEWVVSRTGHWLMTETKAVMDEAALQTVDRKEQEF